MRHRRLRAPVRRQRRTSARISAWSNTIGAGSALQRNARASAASSPPTRLARGAADEDGADGVAARVAARVGVGVELLDQAHVEPGLLVRLAHRRGLERLALVDEAAGQRPAARLVPALDEHHPVARERGSRRRPWAKGGGGGMGGGSPRDGRGQSAPVGAREVRAVSGATRGAATPAGLRCRAGAEGPAGGNAFSTRSRANGIAGRRRAAGDGARRRGRRGRVGGVARAASGGRRA